MSTTAAAVAAYRRRVTTRLVTAAGAAAGLVTAAVWLMATRHTGTAVAVAAVALVVIPATIDRYEAWQGERLRPRWPDLDRPLTDHRRTLVNRMVALTDRLDTAQREALTAAWRTANKHSAYRYTVDRAMLTAELADRLYGDDHANFGAESVDAVTGLPGAADAVLAILVADLAHPADVADLLTAWTRAGLPTPTAEEQVSA